MNIAIIHTRFPSGGAERISIDIAEYLSTIKGGNYKVFLYCKSREEGMMTKRINEVMTIRTTRHSSYVRYKDLLRFIREDKIDLVLMSTKYIHGMRMIQRQTGVKVICANHGAPFWQKDVIITRQQKKHPLLWKLFGEKLYVEQGRAMKKAIAKTRMWYDKCDVYTVLCQAYKEETEAVLGIRPEDSHIVPIENSEKVVEHVEWNKEKTLLYSGRVVYNIKRVDRLLRIWERVQHKMPDWKLQIVGAGSDLDRFKQMAEELHLERIAFEGYQVDVSPYYKKASVVCLTSELEGWPLALTEGQANGCIPVAFGTSAGVREIIGENGECGFLVAPYDEEAYAQTLLKVAGMSDEELLRMRKSGLERRLQFTPELMCEKWRKLFDAMMKR